MDNDNGKKTFSVGIVLSILLVLIIGGIVLSSRWRESKIAQSLKVEGLYVLDENTLLREIYLSKDAALKIGSQNLISLEDTLRTHPLIRTCEVMFSEIGQLTIRLQEKVPEFIVQTSNGEFFYIDRNCVKLPYERYAPYYDLPIVRGIATDSSLDTVGFRRTVEFCDLMALSSKDKSTLDSFSEIIYNNGNITALLAQIPCRLNVGFWKNDKTMSEKIFSAIAFAEKNRLHNKTIDLRWEQMVIIH